ncbi:XRE family transcriptional regulator [Lentisphaerota bacterium ZTH]|nr:helix-turn-helix domain-containing protein [Lentisphaerota bacterium]WET05256.1 XRE family transcriptional regulator [Lentisphaerota bacterium ZTH]
MDAKIKFGLILKSVLKANSKTQKDIAKTLKVSQPYISNIIKGKNFISKHQFDTIKAILDIPPDELESMTRLYILSKTGESQLPAAADEASLVKPGTMQEVPVISFAQAATYEPALEPIDDFAVGCADHFELFKSEIKPGYFALDVEGDSMSPEFPHGTTLLVAGGEYPQRGDIVAAKLRSGQVVVKKYYRKNNIIYLESENPSGKNFEWHCKSDPNYIVWMYPVIEANINLRIRRWERHKSGY